jgi:hypothetical protein
VVAREEPCLEVGMSAGKVIGYIVAGILILFGILVVWGALDPDQGSLGWIPFGVVLVVIGLGIIYLVGRRTPSAEGEEVTLKIDLPADVKLDKFQCENCGGDLTMDHVHMVAGAPTVKCPYCNTTYQLKEEPKW